MSDFSRRPTVEEIEQLREQVRRDPGSPAFVRLGEAYLALGRPHDAIEVGTRGLQVNPDSIAGRMMIGRAYVMLHEWKSAQTELLKLVKADRNHAAGFALLGEVLLRRQDLERALPVLQHAQNLNPTNPYVDDLLRRARTGQPPDPPPPIPVPQDPERSMGAAFAGAPRQTGAPRQAPPATDPLSFGVDEPTRVAGGLAASYEPPPPAYPADAYPPAYPSAQPAGNYPPAYPPAQPAGNYPPAYPPAQPAGNYPPPAPQQPAPARPTGAAMPRQSAAAPAMQPPAADPGAKTIMAGAAPVAPSMPPSPRPTAQPPVAAPPPAAAAPAKAAPGKTTEKKPKAAVAAEQMPPPGPPPGVRPRVLSMEKPTEAAKQALRQAADVGDYLNTLLTQGLLNVPAVNARVEPLTTKPAKRWGRSAVRTFVFLFALLAVGLGGGGYWVYRAELQRKEEVKRHLDRAETLLATASYRDVQAALEETASALERDPSNLVAMARFARVGAAAALLYGSAPTKASAAMVRARDGIQEGQPGHEDVVFAQAALTLATLGDETEGTPADRLSDARSSIDAWLEKHPSHGWMLWLKGLAMLEIGDLSGAAQAFEAAEAAEKSPVIATIYRADLQLDTGDLEGATQRYEKALERAKDHPLAVLGKAFVRIDRADDPADILGELNDTLAEDSGPRVNAYRALAFAMSYLWLRWDYDQFNENLAKADGVKEPRFLARVALAELANGRLTAASETRSRIVWYSKEPKEKHPLVAAVDANLQWLTGLAGPAFEMVKDVQSLRARHVRARALYDLGRTAEALAELAGILEVAAEDWEAQTWHAAARMITTTGAEREEADEALKQLGRQQADKVVRYVHGTAWLRIGNKREARMRFEDSLEDVSKERPNAVAYRAHTALAELDLAEGNVDGAVTHLEAAVELNPGYLPALGLLGRVQLVRGQHAEAAATLRPLVDEPELATAALELAYAEALVGGGNANDEARKQAREAVLRAKDKGAKSDELARVAGLVGDDLAQELGLGSSKKSSGRGRRRGR